MLKTLHDCTFGIGSAKPLPFYVNIFTGTLNAATIDHAKVLHCDGLGIVVAKDLRQWALPWTAIRQIEIVGGE